eukprot:SM000095S24950  [mRNA]  locus=s95:131551:133677:+ [translate_table: standard]
MGGGAFFEDLFAAPGAWPPVPPQAGLARGSPFVPAAVDLHRRQPAAARPEKLAGERKLAGGQPRPTQKDKAVAAHDGDVRHMAANGLGARRPAETGRPVVVPVHWPSSKFSGEASTSSAQHNGESVVPEVAKESKPQTVPVPVKEGKGDAGGPSIPTRPRMEQPAAATKIQAAFRGHAVRASRPLQQLRKLVSLAGSLKDLQTSWETEDKQLLRTDAKVDRRWAELVMSHLLQLDSIQTTNASVRQRRRELVKSAVAFQEAIDAAVSSTPSQASVETPATELNAELTSGLEPSSPAKDLVMEYASNASIAHEVEPSHQEPVATCESRVPEVPEGADSVSSVEGNTEPEAEASKTVTGVPTEPPASSYQLPESQPLESQGLPSTSVEQKAEVFSSSDSVVAQPEEAAAEDSDTAAEAEQSTADAVPSKPEGLCRSEQEESADVAVNLADVSGQQQEPHEAEELQQPLPPPPSEQPAQQQLQQLPQQQPSEQVPEVSQQESSLQPALQPVLDLPQQQQQQQDEISKEDSKALAIKYLVQKVQQQEKDKAMLKLTADLYQAALSRSLSEVKALKVALAQQCGGQVPHVSDLKTGHRAGHSYLQLPPNPHQGLSSNLSR